MQGRVKMWNESGYGFIRTDDGGDVSCIDQRCKVTFRAWPWLLTPCPGIRRRRSFCYIKS